MRPHRITAAIHAIAEACGDLSARKRKGNFFASTVARVEREEHELCDNLRELTEYVEEIEAEARELRARLGEELGDDDHGGAIEALSECTGECAARLAAMAREDRPALHALAAEHGLAVSDADLDGEAEDILAAKAAGHECNACKGRHAHE